MNIKCGICGKEVVVEEDLADGQHVLCPFCGNKSEYRKPSRIELPTGVALRRQSPDAPAQSDSTPAEIMIKRPEMAPAEVKKPLHVIRRESGLSDDPASTERQMASRRLHMAEDHVRFYEEMKDIEHRRRMREKFNGVLMLVAVALCAAGVYWYVGYRNEQRRQAEIAFEAEKNRLEVERAEIERKERLRREAKEKADREKRLAEEARRKEEAERVQTEKAKEANALHESKVLYRKVCALFGNGEFDFLKVMPTNALPGKVAGEFYYLLPFLDNGEIVVCNSSTNGIESVCRLDGSGKRTAFDSDTFLSSLQGKDYLVAHGDKVYFQSKRKKAHVAQISKTEVVDLSKEFFGDVAPEVKRLDLDPDELRFEIVFIPKETKKVIIADTVEYGAQYSLSKVRAAIEEAFPMKTSLYSGAAKGKKFKRTVVLWDGAHGKKGVDGVTYVPRVAPAAAFGRTYTSTYGPGWVYGNEWRNENKRRRRAEYTHAQWQALYDEAVRQEEVERRFYEQQAACGEKKASDAMSKAERDYAAKIDRIYDAGTLYFRAVIERN